MKLLAFAVQDRAVGNFLPPHFFRSEGEMMRAYGEACSDPQHQFARHGEDFWLYRLGEYDDETGVMVLSDAPEFVLKLSALAPAMSQAVAKQLRPNGPIVAEDPADELEAH